MAKHLIYVTIIFFFFCWFLPFISLGLEGNYVLKLVQIYCRLWEFEWNCLWCRTKLSNWAKTQTLFPKIVSGGSVSHTRKRFSFVRVGARAFAPWSAVLCLPCCCPAVFIITHISGSGPVATDLGYQTGTPAGALWVSPLMVLWLALKNDFLTEKWQQRYSEVAFSLTSHFASVIWCGSQWHREFFRGFSLSSATPPTPAFGAEMVTWLFYVLGGAVGELRAGVWIEVWLMEMNLWLHFVRGEAGSWCWGGAGQGEGIQLADCEVRSAWMLTEIQALGLESLITFNMYI